MSGIRIRTADGGETQLPASVVETLAGRMRGELLRPDSPGYDRARTIWNAMVDRHPALIARCSGSADVMAAVQLAAEHHLLLAVRGGGHHIAGNAVCDGGLMIDLSGMRLTRVDPRTRTARVGAGATLADFDHETQAFALATPLGINSTTGIAGLTLGGGFGWLTRKHGMTVDSLRSADVVTADGRSVRADAQENADLFWALRGGGGNFGVVTSFEFDLQELGPQVLAGLIVFRLSEAQRVLQQYRQFTADAPDELSVWAILRKAPPLPFLPEAVHGREVLALPVFYAGPIEQGMRLIEPLRGFGTPVGMAVGPQPYAQWQTAFDPLLTPGARNYWKSHNLISINGEAIAILVDCASKLPSAQCEVFIGQIGGAGARIAPGATAYPHRATNLVVNVHGRWDAPTDDGRCIAWARELFERMRPHAMEAGYVNFLTEDEQGRVRSAYGGNYARLAAIKKRYDPTNLFRLNHNIQPA